MVARRRHILGEIPKHLTMLLLLILTFTSIWMMLVISTKSNKEYLTSPLLVPGASLAQVAENYAGAIEAVLPYFINSLIICVSGVMGILLIGSLAAFVMARYQFPGRDLFYYSLLGIMAFPGVLTLVPAYLVTVNAGLKGTLTAVWLPQIAFWMPMSIFLLRTGFANIPREMFEAARIDGASTWQELRHIGAPLASPMFGTLAILSANSLWNEYIWAQLLLAEKRELWPVTVGLVHQMQNFWSQYGLQMASYTLAALPMLLIFAIGTRYYIEGLTNGMLKF